MMPASETKFVRYNHSPKGYARDARRRRTETRKRSIQTFYAKYGGQAAYMREWYHRKQEEAGCHLRARDFYLAFLFLQAMTEAQVVEI